MRAIVLGLVATAAIALTSGEARAAGTITTIAGGGPAPNIAATAQPMRRRSWPSLVGVPLTPATCRFTPTNAAIPARVRCKVNGVVRARVRLSRLDGTGRYRLLGRVKLPRVGVPPSGVLRVAVGVNGASGKD